MYISEFKGKITADGSSAFPAEAGRYHLYAAYSCPFASRAIILRALKGLEAAVGMTCVNPVKTGKYWSFTDQVEGCSLDEINNCQDLQELYLKAEPNFEGSISVPVLWDKKTGTIVSNDSADILDMMATEMNSLSSDETSRERNLLPREHSEKIEEINGWLHTNLNTGVFKVVRAPNQDSYDSSVKAVFEALDKCDEILSKHRYMIGNELSTCDIRLFTTLIQFDWAYHNLFKCDLKRIVDYPNLWGFLRDVFQLTNISGAVMRRHIRDGYYRSPYFNPSGIVTIGPELDLNSYHGRDNMKD